MKKRKVLGTTITSALLAVALLLQLAAPVLADPSPWTQTSFADFSGGTTSNTAVTSDGGGAVQLATTTAGSPWQINTQAGWAAWQSSSQVAAPGNYLALTRYWDWRNNVAVDNNEVNTPNTSWVQVKRLDLDVTDVNTLRIRVNLRRVTWIGGTVYLRVLVNGVQVYSYSTSSSSYQEREFTYDVSGLSGTIPVIVQLYRNGGFNCFAYNQRFEIDVYRLNYYINGWAIHQYDAGHQVDWTTCSQNTTLPTGTTATFEYRTSDNGSTWSGWTTNCGALANSRYIQQRTNLATTNELVTPQANWTQVNFQYYQASGTFTSSTRDPLANNGTEVDDWGNISWTRNLPAGTNIQFQIATNTDSATWNFVGPDCTAGTYYMTNTGQAINDACHADDRYIRYRAYFTVNAANQANAPRLDDVTITYNQEPEAPTLVGPSGNINDNTPTFQWNAPTDPDGDTGFRYHIQVDNNNDFSSPEVNVTDVNALTYTSGVLADGTYWWRVRARDTVQGAGFTDPYGAWSNVFQIRIDSQEPDSWIDTGSIPPATPEHYGTDANPWVSPITGGASDPAPATGVNLVEVLVHDLTNGNYWNGSAWVSTEPMNWPNATGTTTWSFPLAEGNLTDGHTYEIFSKATDNVGNEETTHGHTWFLYDTTVGFSGRIWYDTNGNGILDGGESGLANVTVNLYDEEMTLLAFDETDGSGNYSFNGPALGLAAGTYTIEVDEADDELDGLTLTSDPDTPLTASYTAGQKVTGLDFGYGPYALIEGYVWDDSNDRDGNRDTGEPGLDNLTVWLRDSVGAIVDTEVTDANGMYRFKGVTAGDYSVDVDQDDADMPDYYYATTPDPLAVTGVGVGNVYSDNDIGYALPVPRTKSLYLHTGNLLDRNAPSGSGTTVSLATNPTWTQSPAMYTDFGLDTGQNVQVYLAGSGTANVTLRYGGPSGTLVGTGSGALGGVINVTPLVNTIPAGQALWLQVTGSGTLNYNGAAPNNSRVDLPAVTYVKVTAVGTYDAAYPGGVATSDFETHHTVYVRVTATDPFGNYDVTSASVNIPGVGTFAMPSVYNNNDTRVFEYAYANAAEGTYNPVVVTVREGSEGTVSATGRTSFRCRSADVWVTKSANPTTVQSEDVVTFTLNYGNQGVLPAQGVVITDTLPAGLTYVGMVSGPAPTINGRQLTWNRGTLASGFSGSLIFQATVDVTGEESGTFVNQVQISTSTGEADTADNTASATVTLSQHANLVIDKTCDAPGHVVEPGDTLVYTIVVQNTDYADATNATIVDAVPAHTTFVGASLDPAGAGTIGAPPNVVTGLTVPGFDGTNPGQVTLYYTVTVHSPLPNGQAITNQATVDSDQTNPVSDSHTDNVSSDHDLTITKSPSANPAPAGEVLTYTIQYGVTGNEPAPDVVIEDTYPTNSTYLNCYGGVSCSESGGVVTWNLGTINPTASGVVTLVVRVNSPQPDRTPLDNHVEISDDDGEFAQFTYNGFVGSGHTLALTKSDNPDPVQAGGSLVYTLNYNVSGSENALGVFITDTVPADTTFASCTGGCTGPDAHGVITWTIGAVNVGSGGSVQFTVNVDDPLPNNTQIHNMAWISDTNRGAPASASAATAVRSDHSFTITKADGPDPVEAGATLRYTITWALSGNEPVTGIFIEDQVPAHTTFLNCGGGLSCDEDGGVVTWQLGDAPSGDANGVVTFAVRVESPLQNGLLLHNTATIDDDDSDRAATSNDATTTVHSDHELWITKTDDPDPVEAGALLEYTINAGVTAGSNGFATGVVITDRVPADTTFHSASGGVAPDAQGYLHWNFGTLPPGATRQVTFTVRVDSPLINGTAISNQAAIFDNEGKYETATIETTVHSDHELNVTKSGVPDPVEAVYGHIDYTINYDVPASGNEPALGVVITDAIPANTVYVAGSCQPTAICSYAGGVVTWNVGDLEPGDSGAASFRVNVPNPLPNGQAIANTVRVSDTDGEYDEYTEIVHVASDHSLSISKSDAPDPVQAGAFITYTIQYNVPAADNEPAPNVVIEDYTPADTTFWSASGATAIDNPGRGNPGLVRWHLGTLMPGASGTVQLVVRVDSPLPNNTWIFNSASVSDDDGETAAVYDVGTRVVSSHGLQISKSDNPDPVQAGGLIDYTIVYTVTGNQAATNVTIRDTIPPNTTFQSCSGGNYCFYNDPLRQVTWGLGRQNPGSGQVHLQVRVNTPLPDGTILHNNLTVSDDEGQTASFHEQTVVHSDHALSVSKSDAPDPVESGAQLVYTIHWQTTGNEPAPNVIITDTVPTNTTFASCGGATCAEDGGVVTWELGTVNSPAQGDVTMTVNVANLLADGTQIANRPYVRDDETATSAGALITTTVRSSHQLVVTKADDPDPVDAGGRIDYTIAYTVTGNQVAPNVVVVDTIPEHTTYVPGSCSGAPCVQNAGVITWTLGALTPPDNGTLGFSVDVASPLPNGTSLFNFVTISDGGGVTAGDYEETRVSSDHALTITKSDAPYDPVQAGALLTYTIQYGVPATGNEPAPNVIIEDSTPANTTFYTATGGLSIEHPDAGGTGAVRWHLGDLNPGDSGQVTLVVRVNDPLPNNTTLNNTATVSDDDGESASEGEATIVRSAHTFVLEKYDTPDPVNPDQIINYTLHWRVTGNEAAQNIVITDTLPANTAFQSCSGCTVYPQGYVQWNLSGSYAPGTEGDESLQVQVNTPLANGTRIYNTARIRDGNNGTPVQTTIETTVSSDHELAVSKSAPSAISAGEMMTYTIQYNISGNEPAPTVVITDAVPANTTYRSCQPAATCSQVGGVVRWNLDNLNPGASGTVYFAVTVRSPLPDGTQINNTVYITDADDGYAEDSTVTTVTSGHGFSLSKRDSGYDPVEAGGQVVYAVDWSVAGTEVAQDVVITDTLPGHTTFASCGPAPCDAAGGVVTWELGDRSPGASGTVTVAVGVESPLPNGTTLTDQVRISDSNDGLPATASEQTTVHSSHVLDVEKGGPATVSAGEQITYTIHWAVTGNETATNLVIDDVTPVNTTFAAASGAVTITHPPAGSAGLVRWQLGNQPPGATGVVTLVVNVNSPLPNGTEIENTATIADGNGGSGDSDSVVTDVTSSHSFVLTKSDTPDPIAPNGIINYTIHWEVRGNERALGVVITDTIPANTSYESCGACVLVGDWVYWDLGDRNPGASSDVFLQVRVDTPLEDGTLIHNAARISDDNGATAVETNITTTVHSDHELTVSKNAPSVIEAGQYINYTINWSVSGNEPAPTVVITDAIPVHTTYVPGSCQPAALCSETGGVVTWDLGDRMPGNSGTVQFTVQAHDPLPDGTQINNTVYITDADDGYAEDSTVTTVTSGHGFSLDKQDTGYDPVEAGGQVVYAVDWSVAGTEVAQDVVITDTLPGHTTFASCGPAPCDAAGGVVTWELGDRSPGASGTVTVAVGVESPLPNGTTLTDQVRISDSNDGLPATASEQTTVHSSHVLDVEKGGPATVSAGGQITYTIHWAVTGNETATNLVVEDSTPENTTFAAASGAVTITHPPAGSAGLVRWQLGNQPPGATGVVTLVVNVNSPLPSDTLIHNVASISDNNGGTTDSDAADTTVVSSHGFVLTKSDDPDPVSPGDLINYTIHWEVTGNETARTMVITDAIPANTTFESCGACVLMGNYVRWDLGIHVPGDEGDVFLQVRTASVLPDGTIITNTARVSDGNNGVPQQTQATTRVESGHILHVDKSAPTTVNAGGQIIYTISYQVTGEEIAPNAVITDAVPANTTYLDDSCTPACVEDGGVLTWNLGTLNPGANGVVQFTVNVASPLDNGTAIVNTAHFSDDDEGYDEDSATTLVSSAPNLSTSGKTVDRATAAPGDNLVYTITLRNTGNATAVGTTVTDGLPDHVAWFGWVAQNDAAYDPGTNTVTWTGNVVPGTDVVIAYRVQVEEPLDDGTVIQNTALINDGVHTPFNTAPAAQTTIHSAPDLTTSFKEVDVVNAAPGQEVEYTLTIINTGNMVAHGAEVLDYVPEHSSFVPGSLTFTSGNAQFQTLYNRIRWTGDVVPGTNVVITFRVELDFPLDEGTQIINWATIDDNFHVTPYDTNTVVTVISAAPDMSGSSKAVDLAAASPDDQLRYTITLVNAGSMTANAHVDDVLPAGVTFVSGPVVTGGGSGGWDAGGRRIYWDGQVAPGHTVTIVYYVRVNNPLNDGTVIVNDATVNDGYHAPFATNQVQTVVHSAPDLTASTKTVDRGTAAPGDRLQYTITLNNTGNMNATNVTVVDTLPPDYVALVATPPGATYDPVAGTLTWTGLTVNRNQPVVLTFQVDLANVLPDGTLIVNHVAINDGFHPGAVEREATTIVGSAPNLTTSSKVVDQANAAPGDNLVYTITLRNTGNATAVGARITDTLPANTTWVGWVTQNGATYNAGTNTVSWTGNVTPGVNVVIAYRVQVNFPLDNGTVIENVATVNDSFAGHAAFDIGPARTTVRSSPNLGTSTKAVNLAEASPGDELVYTITLVNTGNMTAHNAVVLDEIPAHTAYVALSAQASSGNVQYQPAYNRIRWTGEVVPGVNVVITYRVRVDFPLNNGTEIENFATVDDGVHSPFDTNTVVTTIHSAPDLSTSSKTVDLADAVPGQVLHYVITLRNTGDMAAVTAVTDQLPAGVTHAGGPTVQNGPPASWDPIARRISWSGNVVPGTNVTIEYYVTVNSPLNDGTVIENTATINDGVHPAFDTAPAAQTTIHSAPDLTGSTKEVSRTVAPPGETIEYTITLNNGGSMNAPAVMMTDTLPVEVSFVSGPIVTGGGTASYDPVARQIRWSGPVNVNQPVTIRYTVRLNAGLTSGTIVENTATVDDGRGNVFDIGPATTYVGHELGLSLRDNRDTVQPGERITYTVAFSGTEPLNSGTVRIDIPAHATLIAQSPGGINNGVSVDWSLLALPPGFYSERYIVVQLEPVLDNGTVISTTAYIAGDGQSNTATEEAVVVSAPDWETSVKTADRFDVEPGAQFTYTIRLANTGNMHAHAATLEDALPSQVTYVDGSVTSSSGAASYDPATNRILWDGALDVGSETWITFAVTVNAGVLPGTAIENFAYVDDEVNEPAELYCAVNTVAQEPHTYSIFLPLVMRGYGPTTYLPDLVVDKIEVVPANPNAGQPVDVQVTIRNAGNVNASRGFWVDLYVDPPDPSQIRVNRGWNQVGCPQGLVWSVFWLDAGESAVLSTNNDINPDNVLYQPDYSNFGGSFANPWAYTLYVQVDSWNTDTTYGAIYEANENNNVYGPVTVSVGGMAASLPSGSEVPAAIPTRPNEPPRP